MIAEKISRVQGLIDLDPHALDSTRAILASLGGDVSETEKKADSLGE